MLAAACSDLTIGTGETRDTDELLILPLQPGGPAVASATFFVPNARTVTQRLTHNDATFTLYVDVSFPRGSLAELSGTPVGPDDSVRVTLQPRAGSYGLTLSPAGLGLNQSARPSALFDYARYGDLSVADGSPTYPSRPSYASALALWWEITPGRWRRVAGSGPGGPDRVTGLLADPGTYVVAAPR